MSGGDLKGALRRIEKRLKSLESKVDASTKEIVRKTVFVVMPSNPPTGPLPKPARHRQPKRRAR